mmetsp:Transcript_3299/g.3500  ORF Transcript_3299/g.3500 Transcript_3299/m.3500 type:complete len:93 (-) Transcript_3299:337-615(-)
MLKGNGKCKKDKKKPKCGSLKKKKCKKRNDCLFIDNKCNTQTSTEPPTESPSESPTESPTYFPTESTSSFDSTDFPTESTSSFDSTILPTTD